MTESGIKLTREELYQRVWATPAARLATEFGISDVALGKICRRMGIPKPPLGYWRRVEVGLQPPKQPLPAHDEKTLLSVTITRPDCSAESELTDSVLSEKLHAGRLPENKIDVPQSLSDPHPLVAALLRRRERGAGSGDGEADKEDLFLDVEAGDGTLDRALRVMDSFLKAVEARGYGAKVSRDSWGKATRVFCADVDAEVQVSLSESYREVERELTPAERKKPPYLIDNRLVTVPSGKLTFRARDRYSVIKWWKDKKDDPLEQRLNEVVAGVTAALERKRREELARREEKRRRAEEQRLREEEQARREELHREASAWRQAEEIRAYLRAYEGRLRERGGLAPGSEEEIWLRWAHGYADSLDPLCEEGNEDD